MYTPTAPGLPESVITLPDQEAVTPGGSPLGAPIPVAPVVPIVMTGEIGTPVQTIGLDEGKPAVFSGRTFTTIFNGLPAHPLLAAVTE